MSGGDMVGVRSGEAQVRKTGRTPRTIAARRPCSPSILRAGDPPRAGILRDRGSLTVECSDMGLRDWLSRNVYWSEPPETRSSPAPVSSSPVGFPPISTQLDDLTARGFDPSTASASVWRARTLIAGTVAQLVPEVFRSGARIDSPPVVLRPNPWQTRYRFLYETVSAMLDSGTAVWRVTARDSEGRPSAMAVLDPRTYTLDPDDPLRPTIVLRDGRRLRGPADVSNTGDVVLIPLNPRPGDPGGTSPLTSTVLARVLAADAWAASYYQTGAVPTGVLSTEGHLTPEEADELKRRFLESQYGSREPAVLGGGLTYEQTIANPVDAQLSDARTFAVQEIARLFGIPAPMLLASYGGSSLTYSNVTSLFAEFVRATLTPLYLAPIESAWSDLIPRTQAVRFSTDELERADLGARWQAYAIALSSGVLTVDEVREREGIASTDLPPSHLIPSPPPTANAPIPEVPNA